METIKLDLIPGKKMPSLHASQYDDGREHGIDLFENGVVYKLDGTETLTINERKGDDCICSLDIENTFTGSNHIVFASTEQMCAVWGNNICELVIAKGEKTLGTLNFILEIEPSPTEGGIESESEISNLERQITEITEQVIGEDYYTAEQTDNAIATAIEGKADTSYVDTELAKKADKTDTYTKIQVDNALNLKADKNNPTFTGAISQYRRSGSTVGNYSVALGYSNVSSGSASIAEGSNTIASANNAHAEGNATEASARFAHAEGRQTIASAEQSHAEGYNTTASGNQSHAEGWGTEAKGSSQHVSGKYNIVDNNNEYAEIIGNGTSESNRSNARTLDWQGNETLAGDLTYNGNQSVSGEITRLDGRIDNLPAPMIFKGTLGVGGTIQSLPTASASNEGFTYKVITDGTYAGQTAKVGDVFTSNGSAWVYIPSGDEDNDTWRAIKVEGVEKLGNGISSGAVDFVGSDNIEVEFDANGNKVGFKTKNIYTKTEVDSIVSDAIYNVLPDDTASGSVANFTTSLELPLKSLEIDVNAVQEAGTPTPTTPLPISGWSQIALFQRGNNLWNEQWEVGGIDNTTGTDAPINNYFRSVGYTPVPVGENLYLYNGNSDTIGLRFYDRNKTFIGARAFLTSKAMTYGTNDLPTGTAYIRFVNTSTNVYLNNIAINYPSSDNAYHAYNGNTEVINLGGTYYGGHFTQDKDGHRQFEVTHNYIASYNGEAINEPWISSMDAYSQGATPTTGAQVVYPLATPIIIDLPDGEPIITLAGVNNFCADTGDTEVVFKSSVNDYVSAHSGGNLLGMGGVYLGGAKSGGSEEEPDEGEDTEKVKLDDPKEEIKTIGDTKKIGGE